MAEPPDLLLNQHPVAIRLGKITENVIDFYEVITSPKDEKQRAEVEQLFKDFPKLCAAQLRIAPTVLGKVIPNRSIQARAPTPTAPSEKPKGNMTAKELLALNLTPSQLRAIAGMSGVTEAEVVDDGE